MTNTELKSDISHTENTALPCDVTAGEKATHTWCPDLLRKRVPGPIMQGSGVATVGGFSTRSVHAGQYDDPATGAVGTPIFQSSTFLLNEGSYRAIEEGRARDSFIYARYGNPTQWALQEKLANLEQAESAVVFSSGMAAITTTLLALLDRGSHVVTSRDLYGGTYNFFNEDLNQYGMSATFVDPTDLDAIEAAIAERTKILFFEGLTNPLLKVAPIKGLVRLADAYGCRVVIDNTFLGPFNSRPLEAGVDLVVHSGSKYLNGHSDLIAGVAAGSRKLVDRIWAQMLKLGGSLDPHACFLFERGLKTYALRMRCQNDNAVDIANWLKTRTEIRNIYYPGISSPASKSEDGKLPAGFGGVVSFEVVGGNAAAHRFVEALRIPKQATSLGGVESLVSLPYNTSHASLMPSQLKQIGINDGLVRLSVGIEDLGDILIDIGQALDSSISNKSKIND